MDGWRLTFPGGFCCRDFFLSWGCKKKKTRPLLEPCLGSSHADFRILVQCVSCRTKNVNALVHVHLLKLFAGWSKVLAWVKVAWVFCEVAADCCCHSKAAVRVNVNLANSRFCSLAELFFRNTNRIRDLSTVLLDNLYIFYRY